MNPILKLPPSYTNLTLLLCPDCLTSSDYMSLVSPPQVLPGFLTKASTYNSTLHLYTTHIYWEYHLSLCHQTPIDNSLRDVKYLMFCSKLPKLQIFPLAHFHFATILLFCVTANLTEIFLNLTEVFLTLTEVFPSFFLSCKARVKLAKTGHGPHSSTLVIMCCSVVICVLLCIVCV